MVKRTLILGQLFFITLHLNILYAKTYQVPSDFRTIQEALNAAQTDDNITVNSGHYVENIIWPKTNGIVLKGEKSENTIIDGNHKGNIIAFNESLDGIIDKKTHLSGFTLMNGKALEMTSFRGGGIYCHNVSLQLSNLIIKNNQANYGGGLCSIQSELIINSVSIFENSVKSSGAGIYCQDSNLVLSSVSIMDNMANIGSGIYSLGSRIHLVRNTITGNRPLMDIPKTSAFFIFNSNIRIEHSVIWNQYCKNELAFSKYADSNALSISFTNIRGMKESAPENEKTDISWGEGNIDKAPKPSGMQLDMSCDTGFFNDDHVTKNSKNLIIHGVGGEKSIIVLYANGNKISGATATVLEKKFSIPISLPEGINEIRAHYSEKNKEDTINVSDPLTITIDQTSPEMVGLFDHLTPTKSHQWLLKANDNFSSDIRFRYLINQIENALPNTAYTNVAQVELSPEDYQDGIWFLHAQASDSAGNESKVIKVKTIIDNTRPILSGLYNHLTPCMIKSWSWKALDNDPEIQYRHIIDRKPDTIPDGAFNDIHSTQISGEQGTFYLHVQAKDRAGNISDVKTVSVTMDIIPPKVIGIKNDTTPRKQKVWVWHCSKQDNITYRYIINQTEETVIKGDFKSIKTASIRDCDGKWFLHVQAKDITGNIGEIITVSAILDNTPPDIIGLSDDDIPVKTKSWQWHTSEKNQLTYRYLIDQNEKSLPKGAFSNVKSAKISGVDGIWYIHVQAKDIAGNLSKVTTVKASLDNKPPEIKGLSNAKDPVKSIQWSWYALDDDSEIKFRYLIDQKAGSLPESSYTRINKVSISDGDGIRYIHVQAIDRAGNTSEIVSVSAQLDNTPPIITGLSNDLKPQKEKNWSWLSEDVDSQITFRHQINQIADTLPSGKFDQQKKSRLSDVDGKWYLHVQAKDRAGNISPVVHVETLLDNTAPIIKGFSNDLVFSKTKTFSWHAIDADPETGFRFLVDQFQNSFPSGSFTSVRSTEITSGDGLWFVHVQAKDRAGNISPVQTVKAMIDNTSPVISGLNNDFIPAKEKKWSWQAEDSDNQILYRFLIDKNTDALLSGDYHSNNTASIDNDDGLFYLHVQAIDRSGNESETVHVSALLDNTAPQIKGLQSDSSPVREKTWQWRIHDSDPYISSRYIINENAEPKQFGSFSNELSAYIAGKTGQYYIHVQAKDRAGNLSDIVSVSSIIDNKPPVIKGLADDPFPIKEKQWTFCTDNPQENVLYQIVINQQKKSSTSGPFISKNYTSISNTDGIWYLHIIAKDDAGNISDQVTVSAILDNTRPEITGLTSDHFPTKQKIWIWAANDTDQQIVYRYLIDQLASSMPLSSFTSITSADISGNDGNWYLHLQAKDRAGNISEIVTVSCLLDNTSPVVTGLSSLHIPLTFFRWHWNARDHDPSVTFRSLLNQTPVSPLLSNFSDESSIDAIGLDGKWYLHVQAKDRAGNISETVVVSAEFDNTAPIIEGLSNDLNPKKYETWQWRGKDNDIQLSYRYVISRLKKSKPSGQFSDISTADISGKDGLWYIHVQAKDRAGNHSGIMSVCTLLDNTPPVITDIYNDPIPTKQKSFLWHALDEDKEISYRHLLTQFSDAVPSGTFSQTNKLDITEGDGLWYLKVQGLDRAKNMSDVITVSAIIDNTPPVITGLEKTTVPVQSKIWSWGVNDSDNHITYRFSIDQNKTSTTEGSFSSVNRFLLKNTDGLWYIHVQAKDRAGNLSDTVTVSAMIDNTPPIITGLKNSTNPTQFMRWQWHVNDDDVYIQYRFQADQMPNALPSGTFSDQNEFTLENVNGIWFFHVQARDQAGNLSNIVSVSAVLDNTPPVVTDLFDDLQPVQTKTWLWGTEPENKNYYRYNINQLSSFKLSGEYKQSNTAHLKDVNGKWYIHVQARDEALNISQQVSVSAIIDTIAPKITGLENQSIPMKKAFWKWNADDIDQSLFFRYLIDQNPDTKPSGKFQKVYQASLSHGNGTWYIHVQAKDRAGNISAVETVSVVLDNIAPVVLGLSENQYPVQQKTWTFSGKDSDSDIQYRYIIDRMPKSMPENIFSYETTATLNNGDGLYYLHVQAKDRAGNLSEISTVSVLLDNTGPEITGLSDDTYPRQSKTWHWNASDKDNHLIYRYSIDQLSDSEASGSFTHVNTVHLSKQNGIWYLHVQAKDRAGNISKTFTVSTLLDNKSPIITGLDNDLIPKKEKQWFFSCTDDDTEITFRYHIDQSVETSPSTAFTSVSKALISSVNGLWYIHVQARDRAGNVSEVKTVSAILDNQPPQIIGITNDMMPVKSKTWKWQAEDSDSKIQYRHIIDQNPFSKPDGSFEQRTTAFLSNTEGLWYIHVQALDTAGNLSDIVTGSAIMDNSMPVITGLSDDTFPVKQKVWSWDKEDGVTYRYLIDQKLETTPEGSFSKTTTAMIDQNDGQWFIHVQAKDRAGNLSDVVTVSAILDNQPPEIRGLVDDIIPKKQQTWKWTYQDTDEQITSRYSIDMHPETMPSGVFLQKTAVSTNQKDGKYYIHVQAKDRAGNLSKVISVYSVLDNTSPEITGLFSSEIPVQKKTITWKANDTDTDIYYRFDINQQPVFHSFPPEIVYGKKTQTSINGLDGNWYLHVQAIDRAGNESAIVSVVSVFDNTKPVIKGLSDDRLPCKKKEWVWFAEDIDSTIEYRYLVSKETNINIQNKFSGETRASMDINGQWYIHVQARDRAGNFSEIKTVSALIDNESPEIVGIKDDPFPGQRKSWRWQAVDSDQDIQYSFLIDQKENSEPTRNYTYT
ncbi:hypothetical protein MHK_006719, partial [Candidatus Magnetomorum sp. HK-1]